MVLATWTFFLYIDVYIKLTNNTYFRWRTCLVSYIHHKHHLYRKIVNDLTNVIPSMFPSALSGKRRKKKRGHGWSHRPRRSLTHDQPEPENHPQYKMFHSKYNLPHVFSFSFLLPSSALPFFSRGSFFFFFFSLIKSRRSDLLSIYLPFPASPHFLFHLFNSDVVCLGWTWAWLRSFAAKVWLLNFPFFFFFFKPPLEKILEPLHATQLSSCTSVFQ